MKLTKAVFIDRPNINLRIEELEAEGYEYLESNRTHMVFCKEEPQHHEEEIVDLVEEIEELEATIDKLRCGE